MKNIKYIIFVILLLLIGGCSKNNDSLKKESVQNSFFDNNFIKRKWDCEIPLNEIKEISGYDLMFITNSNELYLFSLDKPFSNESYCKKIDSDFKFERFINGSLIVNNKAYVYDKDKFVDNFNGYGAAINIELFKKYPTMFLFTKHYGRDNFDINHSYAIIENNVVYELKQFYDNKKNRNDYEKISLGSIPNDEKFIGAYYQIIKTDKNYYSYGAINQEECNKYQDVECKYGLHTIDDINKYYDDIQFFNGKFLVLKNDMQNIYYYN